MSYESLEGAVQQLVTTNSALVAAVTGTQQEATSAIAKAEQSAIKAKDSEISSGQLLTQTESHADRAQAKAIESESSAVRSKASEVASAASAATAAAVVTGGTASLTPEAGKIPLANSKGKVNAGWIELKQSTGKSKEEAMSQWAVTNALKGFVSEFNDIGVAGQIGFGVGICPLEYDGMTPMAGSLIKGSDNYGNYHYKDGSVMCWVPAFYYRWGNAASPHYAAHGENACDILPISAFPSILAAAVAGWPLHRAFYDDGVIQPGVFVDKYKCSNNGGVASSIKGGIPLSSNAANNPFSGLNGSPANIYAGAIDAAKTRGPDFHPTSAFIPNMLHTLSIAHGQAAANSAVCAWYDATGVNNFPKGCNNNALGDINDSSVSYESTGYSNAGKTGSGQPFAKTTHNGQNCGVADINGGMWELCPGLTVQDGNYYILKTSARMADLTSGATLDTDAWGVPAMAKSFDLLGTSHQALGSNIGGNSAIGSANQVFSNATEGNDWAAAGAGIPNLNGIGGSNLFGNDRFYDNNPQHMCLIACGAWDGATGAGPGARSCGGSRARSYDYVSFRAALYLARRSDSEGGAP